MTTRCGMCIELTPEKTASSIPVSTSYRKGSHRFAMDFVKSGCFVRMSITSAINSASAAGACRSALALFLPNERNDAQESAAQAKGVRLTKMPHKAARRPSGF